MRPEKFEYQVDRAFDSWFATRSFSVSKVLLREMKRVYKKYAKAENDFRSGYDTYAYENVDAELFYISDRWKCSFRLRWLIDGIEAGYIK
jgi:hypothetical protein